MATIQGQRRSQRRRILVVDDEPHIRGMVIRALESAGYAIDSAGDGRAGLALALAGDYQLVILDLVMPFGDGRDIIGRLRRERPDEPVLVLSCLADITTKVACLDMGAHDYLTKPFSIEELLARVRVQLRDEHQPGEHQPGDFIRAGNLVLDLGRMQADAGLGPVPLTRLEVMLLRELMEHIGQSVPKDTLLASVWGLDFNPGSNVVDVCVRRLRSKLGFDLIQTVRGAGYRLAS
ncbi:MAG TPA: response regulator transcription factor [Streptosporangiaceae bacterium]|nr:response regulator transcription factor [Streptosporangiaceae bacterium]